jgi:hypothetical protein
MKENRKFKRFCVPEGKVFLLNHFSAKIGWVKNLSIGGLSFEFLCKQGAVVNSEVIDLFSYDYNQMFLAGLPCHKVYEIEKNGTFETPEDNRKTKLCGLEFMNLDSHQKTRIESLINTHLNG